jgi:hypothetical protein
LCRRMICMTVCRENTSPPAASMFCSSAPSTCPLRSCEAKEGDDVDGEMR